MKFKLTRAALAALASALVTELLALTPGCAAIDRSSSNQTSGAGGAPDAGVGGESDAGTSPGGRRPMSAAGSSGSAGESGRTHLEAGDGGAGESTTGGVSSSGAGSATNSEAGADGGVSGDGTGVGGSFVGAELIGPELITDLEDGYYSLQARATKTGAGNCFISVKDYGGGLERMTSLPVTTQPTTLFVRGVQVVGGQATIGAYHDADGTNCTVSDAHLVRDSVSYQFLKGGDVSEVTRTEDSGATYRDSDGTAMDPFEILTKHGYNIARLRLYNDPGNPSFYPSSEMPAYSGPADILKLAQRAKAQGLMIELTFHYSDYWTNAGTQCMPHEWASLATFPEVLSAMKGFTQDFMQQMADQGTTPEFVSIGNESNGGLLYPFGCAWVLPQSSYCPTETCTAANWPQLGQLYGAAYDAVKAVSPTTQVIVHLAYENGSSPAVAAPDFNSYFAKIIANGGNYDIKGLSYYPYWTRSKVSDLVDMVNLATAGNSKPVLIMETGYNWNATRQNGTLGQLRDNGPELYPSTPQGQKDFLLSLYAGIKRVSGGKCLGALYWDPVNIIQNSQVSNTALFDFGGKALPGLDASEFNN
jgi:arabinogalactan endo-1,4-beta-galactosidase